MTESLLKMGPVRKKRYEREKTMSFSSKKTTLLLAISIALLSVFSGCAKPKSLNIIFITIDTLRADHLGCYGYKRNTSPNIDKFAQQNMLFQNFFTVVPKTGPSMTSFFTGLYMQNHGVVDNNYLRDPSTESFIQLLPKHYQKAAFIANPALSASRGYAKGFDEYQVASPNNNMGEWGQGDISPKAITWLNSAKEKGNFFLWVHYVDPHGPYTPPAEYRDLFVDDDHYDSSRKVPLDYTPEEGINENYILGAVPKYQRLEDIDTVDYYIAKYDAEIKYTDAEVGKVLDYLRASKLLDNTIVVITADHGESLGENNYYFEHGMLVNEGSIHIPLIIKHPDIKGNIIFDTLMQSTDIAPTLLNFLSIDSLKKTDGLDFSNLISQKRTKDNLHQYVYSCTPYGYKNFHEAIRTKNDKIGRMNEQEYSYFELSSDISETKNKYQEADSTYLSAQTALFTSFGKKTIRTPVKESRLQKAEAEKLRSLGYTH